MTTAAELASYASSFPSFRNRIINGDMRIDQRNAGAAVNPVNVYTLDRWRGDASVSAGSKYTLQQNAGSVTPPAGYINYLGCTSSSAYSVGASELFGIRQSIEGLNVADLAWGTASAATITISFWVRSSLTGAFGGTVKSSGGSRSYPFQYTISSANTWEQKTVTIPGDTSGTWLTTNGIGIQLFFSIGADSTVSGTAGSWSSTNYSSATGSTSVVGTSGATWYITGVQLEVGTVATPFEHRPYGTELALCQRYYVDTRNGKPSTRLFIGPAINTSRIAVSNAFPVPMRTNPTVVIYSNSNETAGKVSPYNASGTDTGGTVTTSGTSSGGYGIRLNDDGTAFTQGDFYVHKYSALAEL